MPPPDERPSKSELKRQAHALQDLGEALAALPHDRLTALPLPDTLLAALQDFKRTRSHEGRRRQMQYVGKLLRQLEPEPLDAVRETVAASQLGRARDTLALHRAERWREELMADEDALTRWLNDHPRCDAQQLRSLLRAARKDAATPPEQRHGKAYRELFQFIKQAMQDHE